MKEEELGKHAEVQASAGITPTPHTMFFHRSGQQLEAEAMYRAALEAQRAKAPGARPLPQNLGLPHGSALEAKAAQAAAAREEAQAMKAAEDTARQHQAEEQQQVQQKQAESYEEMFQKETRLKEDLEKQQSQLSQRHSSYCQREVSAQARMAERETRIQENSEYQQQVQAEVARLGAVLMLRENPEERQLLGEFTAFDMRLSEKHQEYMAQQHEDVAKQRRFAEKKAALQENEEHLANLQVKNRRTLQKLEAHLRQQFPDPRSVNSKRLLSQLMAAEKADSDAAALRKEQKARRLHKSVETSQEFLVEQESAMEQEQQRQQRLQDENIQAEEQAKAEANAIVQQQEQAEQEAAMAEVAKATAEQEEQRQQLLQEEQQRQQEWQNYLRAKMVEGQKREEAMFAEHKQQQDRLKAELAAEEQKHMASLRQQHQQRLQELEQRSAQQRQEISQYEQHTQLELQQKLEATNTMQLLPPLDFSEEESLTPVAKKPRSYTQLRGELPRYMPPSSKAQAPIPAALPQAKAPGTYQPQALTSPEIPAAFASPASQTAHSPPVAFTPGRLEGGSGLFCSALPSPALDSQLLSLHGQLLLLQQHLLFRALPLWNHSPSSRSSRCKAQQTQHLQSKLLWHKVLRQQRQKSILVGIYFFFCKQPGLHKETS